MNAPEQLPEDAPLSPEEQAADARQGEYVGWEQETTAKRKKRRSSQPRTRIDKPSYAGGMYYEMPGGAMYTHPDDR
ncbi:hypothetical protein [Nocardiopsis synnemataformans]|uniref:hypothetical protein n=1 Tax=Nocardiopsis synnemataformans TaxID=61305 RepID=UPI003EB75694